jgi:flavin-dependent dehydrogenase
MSNADLRPIEIIGGGLAGLALGIGLRRFGVPVKVIEAGDYPRHRVCGEFIAGLPGRTMQRLGIEKVFEGTLRHTGVHWFRGDHPVARMRLPSPAIGVSRFTLDSRLASLFVAQGGELVTCHRVMGEITGDGRVQAAGRRRSVDSSWVGLKAHVRNLSLSDDLELHLGEGAYVGLAPVGDGWIDVCGLFKRQGVLKGDSPDALAQTLRGRGLDALAKRVTGAELRAGSATAVAGFVFDGQVAPRRGVMLGDSCAMIPPFTGHGMAMAFIAAELALEPLVDWAASRVSWEDTSVRVHKDLQRTFRTRLRSAQLLHPLLLGRRGQAFLGALASNHLLPMRALYHLLH